MTLQPGSPICVSCHHWGPSVGSRGPKGIIPGGVLLIGAQWWDLGYSAIVSILSPLRCSCIILELSVTPVHKITLLRPALFPGAAFVFGACLCAWELTARLPCFAAGRPVSIYSFPEAHLCASRKPSSQLHARLLFTALAPLELANISQRQFLFLGDTEQIRNSPRIFQRALRRSSEIGSGGGGSNTWLHLKSQSTGVQMACPVMRTRFHEKNITGFRKARKIAATWWMCSWSRITGPLRTTRERRGHWGPGGLHV